MNLKRFADCILKGLVTTGLVGIGWVIGDYILYKVQPFDVYYRGWFFGLACAANAYWAAED